MGRRSGQRSEGPALLWAPLAPKPRAADPAHVSAIDPRERVGAGPGGTGLASVEQLEEDEMTDVKQGEVLVIWEDSAGLLHIRNRGDTVRRAKAWCRANGDAFDFEDVDEVDNASVLIVEVKAVTRPQLTVVVDFGGEGEKAAEPHIADPHDLEVRESGVSKAVIDALTVRV